MAGQADVKEDFLQEEAAASQGRQGPGPHSHHTQRRPPFSGLPVEKGSIRSTWLCSHCDRRTLGLPSRPSGVSVCQAWTSSLIVAPNGPGSFLTMERKAPNSGRGPSGHGAENALSCSPRRWAPPGSLEPPEGFPV